MCCMKHLRAAVGDPGEKYLTKSIKHMNIYTKLLTDLINVDVKIDEEDKTVILLISLPEEEYETFTLILINGRRSLNYNEVSLLL